jgi:DNA-binding MarR family transcriptional regulator
MDRVHNFGFLIKDISRLHSKNFERHAAGLNMSFAQCKVLAYLERNEGASQVRLAELSDTDPMTLVRIIDRMEGDGWVERRADPGDRRARRLFLKDAARAVLQEMSRVASVARAEALAGLSAADRETLIDLLGRIHENLDVSVPEADDETPAKPAARAPRRAASRSNSRGARR